MAKPTFSTLKVTLDQDAEPIKVSIAFFADAAAPSSSKGPTARPHRENFIKMVDVTKLIFKYPSSQSSRINKRFCDKLKKWTNSKNKGGKAEAPSAEDIVKAAKGKDEEIFNKAQHTKYEDFCKKFGNINYLTNNGLKLYVSILRETDADKVPVKYFIENEKSIFKDLFGREGVPESPMLSIQLPRNEKMTFDEQVLQKATRFVKKENILSLYGPGVHDVEVVEYFIRNFNLDVQESVELYHRAMLERDCVWDADTQFAVEKILDRRVDEKSGTLEYFVKWQGWRDDSNSWINESNFADDYLVRKYDETRRLETDKKRKRNTQKRTFSEAIKTDEDQNAEKKIKEYDVVSVKQAIPGESFIYGQKFNDKMWKIKKRTQRRRKPGIQSYGKSDKLNDVQTERIQDILSGHCDFERFATIGKITNPENPAMKGQDGNIHTDVHGVFCKVDLPAGFVLLEYVGEVSDTEEKSEWGYDVQTQTTFSFKNDQVHLDASKYRNASAYINDPRVFESIGNFELPLTESDSRTANVEFLSCYVDGWPHCFICTTKTIKAEEELLLDYGAPFWSTYHFILCKNKEHERIMKFVEQTMKIRQTKWIKENIPDPREFLFKLKRDEELKRLETERQAAGTPSPSKKGPPSMSSSLRRSPRRLSFTSVPSTPNASSTRNAPSTPNAPSTLNLPSTLNTPSTPNAASTPKKDNRPLTEEDVECFRRGVQNIIPRNLTDFSMDLHMDVILHELQHRIKTVKALNERQKKQNEQTRAIIKEEKERKQKINKKKRKKRWC